MTAPGSPWQPRDKPEPKQAAYASPRQVGRRRVTRFADAELPQPPALIEGQLDMFGEDEPQ